MVIRGIQGEAFSLQLRPLRAEFHEVSRAVNEFEFDKALQLLAPLLG
ncbi:hypothetical protein [Aeromonas veronii]